MRIRRLALLTSVAAAIGGALWWKKSRDNYMQDDAKLVDLSTNGQDAEDVRDQQSELSRRL
jgi:hypothetical protein